MLSDVILKANLILTDARQRLTIQSADAVEKVCLSIEILNRYINQEMDRIQKGPKISSKERSAVKRGVWEQAGRKLEVLKDRSNYSNLIQDSNTDAPDATEQEESKVLQYLREREIRDRLFGMTEAQVLSHFGESLFDGTNQLILDAILNAPPGFEVLSEQNLRKLRRIKAQSLTDKAAAEPKFERAASASILEIFTLAKDKLDRLRKKELPGNQVS